MKAKSANYGICAHCGHRATRTAMVSHLEKCLAAEESAARAHGQILPAAFLRFEAEGDPRYWLVLAVSPKATLRHIDALLRDVWLECCGHLSAFYFDRREVAMRLFARDVFLELATRVRYEYDFGSTTSLVGRRLNAGSDIGPGAPVRLLARNEPLQWSCAQCSKPATIVCPFCLDETGLLCAHHAGDHEHAEEGVYLPVVNSPRMGVCGYTG